MSNPFEEYNDGEINQLITLGGGVDNRTLVSLGESVGALHILVNDEDGEACVELSGQEAYALCAVLVEYVARTQR